jgi:anti-anti-sigma factor
MNAVTPFRYLRCYQEQGATVITITESELHGDGLTGMLAEELLAAVSGPGPQRIVLDFQKVTFITSAVFEALFRLRRKILDRGGRLVLCGLSPPLAEVFHVARLTANHDPGPAPFEAQPDVAGALACLEDVHCRAEEKK